jgi:hypothetical protein
MDALPAQEMARRLNALHPVARRALAAQTDTTYRGPHNICKGEPEPYRLFGISERVFSIAAGLAGLSWLMMLAQGLG